MHNVFFLFCCAALLGAPLRCSVRGGGGSPGVEPEPKHWRHSALLQILQDLGARDQSHELPEDGKVISVKDSQRYTLSIPTVLAEKT